MSREDNVEPPADDDWLRPRVLACPGCGTSMFQVDHSPFIDAWRIYCDRCPQSVEVSFYDRVVDRIRTLYPSAEDKAAFFGEIERRLKDCACGGTYRFQVPRRCYNCGCEVTDDPSVDLYVYLGVEPELEHRDSAEAEQAVFDDWQSRFVKTTYLWRED